MTDVIGFDARKFENSIGASDKKLCIVWADLPMKVVIVFWNALSETSPILQVARKCRIDGFMSSVKLCIKGRLRSVFEEYPSSIKSNNEFIS